MSQEIQLLSNSATIGAVRRESLNGKEYLVSPMTMIVPGVLPGSSGTILYTKSKINERPNRWNGMPIVVNHPEDETGQKISARSPQVLEQFGIGFVFNVKGGNKLTAEAWIDIDKASVVEPRIVEALNANNQLELSTGLYTKTNKRSGTFKGVTYNQVLIEFDPDHLAILPDERGACNIEDGCGLNVNKLHEYEDLGWTELVTNKELPAGKSLNKPFRTPDGPKKFGVYVKNDKGSLVVVRFGDPNMEIKRDDPNRRKSFRARHGCDKNPGPKWKAKYWSCRFWEKGKSVTSLTKNEKDDPEFKPHMMYSKDKAKLVKSYEEHLELKKNGWSNTKNSHKPNCDCPTCKKKNKIQNNHNRAGDHKGTRQNPNRGGGSKTTGKKSRKSGGTKSGGTKSGGGGGGSSGEKKKSKSEIAKAHKVKVAKDIQRYSEENNEPMLARALKGSPLSNNEPMDVTCSLGGMTHGIELKTMTVGKNNKITIKGDAKARKKSWERKNKARGHLVVFDDTKVYNAKGKGKHDYSKRKMYYKRGFGSFRKGSMQPVKNYSELKDLMTMPTKSLPKNAKV